MHRHERPRSPIRGVAQAIVAAVSAFAMTALIALVASCGTSEEPLPDSDADTGTGDVTDCDTHCPAISSAPICDGDVLVTWRMEQDPHTCECTEVPIRDDCRGDGRVCEGGQCVVPDGCTGDSDCVGAAPPVCDINDIVIETGYCDLDGGSVCRATEQREVCPEACDDGRCVPRAEGCDEDPCNLVDLARPRCDGLTWVTPYAVFDQLNCECVLREQRWPCAEGLSCEPDRGCVTDCEEPCPVFDLPEPRCEGDEVVQEQGFVQDPETCECLMQVSRIDCAADDRVCRGGVCVDP